MRMQTGTIPGNLKIIERDQSYFMKTINVSCSRSYEILIERGLLSRAGSVITERFPGRRYCIISDENVAALYLEQTVKSFPGGEKPLSFVFTPGEAHKTLETVQRILEFLADRHFSRSDMLIALGGGITGDITGFAAAVYLRGMEFVQIPTTLLSAVDSSVGGKTGVNLGGLKNQVGAFWQPSLVISDPDTLNTLPQKEFACGMAEVIKYAAICDPGLGKQLSGDYDISDIISRCVSIKRDIVASDERDTGVRQKLNLGHTFGHAIEKVSDNAFSHGEAVAIGTVMAFRAAEKLGMCDDGETEKAIALFERFALPVSCELDRKMMFEAMKNDKKRAGGVISLVLPESFGSCVLRRMTYEELWEILSDKT